MERHTHTNTHPRLDQPWHRSLLGDERSLVVAGLHLQRGKLMNPFVFFTWETCANRSFVVIPFKANGETTYSETRTGA